MRTTSLPVKQLLLSASIAMVLSACATSREELPELQSARAVVAQVEASPLADRAAANVNDAKNALAKANEAAEEGKDVHEVKHLAYVATRNAQIANEKILTAQAEESIRQGEAERQRVLAQARSSEAEEARRQAQQAQGKAQEAQTEAQRLAMEREELQRQLESLKDLNAKKTERGLVLTLGDVLFDVDKSTLKPGAMSTMDRLADFLKQEDNRSVVVEGHTDSTGSDDYNMDLSRRRADAVRTALVERGVKSDQIQATGKGEGVPVASNDNAGGRQQNRRVEIVVPDEGRVAREGDE
jgi:OmpA-OmpF porin, OOP family